MRPGSISANLIRDMNQQAGLPRIQEVALPKINQALSLLRSGKADAVLGDELQLRYALAQHAGSGLPVLALRDLRPESQGFALSPQLDSATALRIDLAISLLKRSDEVRLLREESLRGPGKHEPDR